MTDENAQQPEENPADFIAESEKPALPIWREFLEFLIHQPSWWLVPIILVLLLFGLAVVLIPAEALPFIYTLF